jgi:PEP-CTERM motif
VGLSFTYLGKGKMKKAILIGGAIAAATSAMAQDDVLLNGSMIWEGQLAVKANTGQGVSEAADVYSNVTNFTGNGFINGGATAGITTLVADNLITTLPGAPLVGFTFSVANFDTVAFTARPRVRFYADDNAGAPGTLLAGFSFNPISFGAGSVGLFGTGVIAQFTTVPANGRIWAGITFDNVGATATNANLNNLGQGIFDPATIGSSADDFWQTTAAGSHFNNAPAGSLLNFNGTPIANYGWALTSSVPEPASMIAIGLGIAGLAAKRRRKSA